MEKNILKKKERISESVLLLNKLNISQELAIGAIVQNKDRYSKENLIEFIGLYTADSTEIHSAVIDLLNDKSSVADTRNRVNRVYSGEFAKDEVEKARVAKKDEARVAVEAETNNKQKMPIHISSAEALSVVPSHVIEHMIAEFSQVLSVRKENETKKN